MSYTEEDMMEPAPVSMAVVHEREETDRFQAIEAALRREYDNACFWLMSSLGKAKGRRQYSKSWNAGKTKYGTKQADVWGKLAAACCRENIDPVSLIRAAFHGATTMVMPTMLLGPACREKLARFREFRDEEVRLALPHQREVFCRLVHRSYPSDWTVRDVWRYVLTDETLELSSLFRYAVALDGGLPEIAEHYFLLARDQYRLDSELYDKHWAPVFVPATLRVVLNCQPQENGVDDA